MPMVPLTSLLSTIVCARDIIPFDYAWRFRTVVGMQPRSACPTFNTSVASGGTCSGLTPTRAGDINASACRQACCVSSTCFVYQYAQDKNAVPSGAARCWIGQCKTPFRGNISGWISGAAPVQPVLPGCAIDVNDSNWDLVDAPHDYIISQPIDKSENAGAGYVSLIKSMEQHACVASPHLHTNLFSILNTIFCFVVSSCGRCV